jgi:hypothetical protein
MITATVRYKLPPHIDEAARAFYGGPWLQGIIERYGMEPDIHFYEVFALTDNARGTVERFEAPVLRRSAT